MIAGAQDLAPHGFRLATLLLSGQGELRNHLTHPPFWRMWLSKECHKESNTGVVSFMSSPFTDPQRLSQSQESVIKSPVSLRANTLRSTQPQTHS